jgi:predicted amidohydrolase YtcJ
MMTSLAPDMIVHNGKFISLDGASRIHDAVLIKNSRFAAVGHGTEFLKNAASETQIIDLAGRSVVPGLIDGHAHLDREGLRHVYPSLAGCRSIDDILDKIKEQVAKALPGQWIVTMPIGEPPSYWDVPGILAEKRWPTRHDLDKVAPDNPVYIRPIWGYWRLDFKPLFSVANTRALEAAGIGRTTEPPCASVEFQKDGNGELTGVIVEKTIMPIVELTLLRMAGSFTHEDRVQGLRKSLEVYHSLGTTGVYEGHGVAPEVLNAYRELHDQGALTMRADLLFSPAWGTTNGAPVADMVEGWASTIAGRGFGDDRLRLAGMFAEIMANAEESRVRSSARPYTGWAGFYYDQQLAKPELVEALVAAARNGIRICTLTTQMLPHLEEANRIASIRDLRWVMAHVGVMDDEITARVRDLGLVTSANSNRYISRDGSKNKTELGPARAHEIMPFKRLKEMGVPVSLATDNVPCSLFHPVWQAVARRDMATGEQIAPEQCISREDALRAATINGAYLSMSENDRGTIEVGKLADFAVLSADPLTCPEDDLKDLTADMTVVGGRVVYEKPREK